MDENYQTSKELINKISTDLEFLIKSLLVNVSKSEEEYLKNCEETFQLAMKIKSFSKDPVELWSAIVAHSTLLLALLPELFPEEKQD